jgi:hypothetical protein
MNRQIAAKIGVDTDVIAARAEVQVNFGDTAHGRVNADFPIVMHGRPVQPMDDKCSIRVGAYSDFVIQDIAVNSEFAAGRKADDNVARQ